MYFIESLYKKKKEILDNKYDKFIFLRLSRFINTIIYWGCTRALKLQMHSQKKEKTIYHDFV